MVRMVSRLARASFWSKITSDAQRGPRPATQSRLVAALLCIVGGGRIYPPPTPAAPRGLPPPRRLMRPLGGAGGGKARRAGAFWAVDFCSGSQLYAPGQTSSLFLKE